MSVADGDVPRRYREIVVVGGGCYGSYYVRQLRRAHAAGALAWDRLLVVDRDAACAVARDVARTAAPSADADDASFGSAVTFVQGEWSSFFDEYLATASDGAAARGCAIVPSPLMPHLMLHWTLGRARARWPGRDLGIVPLGGPLDVPWQRAGDDGTHYVSFATWECPINCIEPRTCPHTRGPRSWSLPAAVHTFVEAERQRGRRLDGPAVFHCAHRAYGVGMFDVADVVAADRLVARVAQDCAAEVLLGTASHCHGALAVLALGPPVRPVVTAGVAAGGA